MQVGISVGVASNSFRVVVSVDTTAPVINTFTYDNATQSATLDITESSGTSTVAWATSATTDSPTFSIGGGWVGTTLETGTFTATSGGDTDIVSIADSTSDRKMTVYAYDAANNLSSPATTTVTGVAAGIQYVGGASFTSQDSQSIQSLSLTGLTGGIASAPATGDLIIVTTGISSTAARAASVTDGSDVSYTADEAGYSNDLYDAVTRMFYKVAGASETIVKVSPSTSTGDGYSVNVQVFRGVNQTTPLDVTTPTENIGTGDDPNPPAITPVTSGAVIYVVGQYASSDAGAAVELTETYLSNVLSSTGKNTSTSRLVGLRSGTVAWTSGAYDPGVMTGTLNVAGSTWVGMTFALRPA